eukprot:TRINITY_DN62926_c0_g1_i1.p1 TRINITY_DN62926_c0_g1~~TRINITY_DN62926_c0_g1_i1.p1  ORF type:complete len:231 (+),score=24.03 TRINITY_DN62926_c0_g1_i1:123-815(+)
MMSPEVSRNTMFFCVPLRLAIWVSAIVTTLASLLYILNYATFVHLFRDFAGGFGNGGRIATAIGEYAGLFFGILGVGGTWYGRRDWIQSFYVGLYFRLLCFAVMYYFDIPLVAHCEDWVNNLRSATDTYGWNELMYHIAMHGDCESTRDRFFVLSLLTVFVHMYLVSATQRYLEYMGRLPKHLLRMPKDLTSGAFYSSSLGDRSALDGHRGMFEHHRVGEEPVGGAPYMV